MANSATDDFIEMSTSTKTQKHERQSPFIIFETTRAPNLFFFSRDVVRTPGKYVYAFTA